MDRRHLTSCARSLHRNFLGSRALHASRPEANAIGVGIAVASSILMPFLAAAKKRIGRRIGSKASNRTGHAAGSAHTCRRFLAGVGATALLGWWWADAVAALGFVWFVTREGFEAVNEARGIDAHE